MTAIVLDASALLTLLHQEPGWQHVAERIGGAIISAVNLVEVMDKLIQRGMAAEAAKDALDFLKLDIRDFTRPLAEVASVLLPQTKPYGLSLADRACLSIAKMEKAVALAIAPGNRCRRPLVWTCC
jgi:PIN domain nuclease of toxin-antitoxin system